jgi:hypothetical protein
MATTEEIRQRSAERRATGQSEPTAQEKAAQYLRDAREAWTQTLDGQADPKAGLETTQTLALLAIATMLVGR